MHNKLKQALDLLDINAISLRDENGTVVRQVSAEEHATALFSYLDLAGYLNPELLEKAINYLSLARPFWCSNTEVVKHLQDVYKATHENGSFNTALFFSEFCNQIYFEVDDIIDLITFLQQTAFDRQFGVERDKLKAKPWLELHAEEFRKLATTLGIVTPLPPASKTYCGTGIMGAASFRVKTRIQHFNSLTVNVGETWALSGNRELSKGLDEEVLMQEIALATNKDKPATFIEKGEGAAKRTFLNGITETMMVNYLLQKMCEGKKIALVDSQVEKDHWRATTSQSAKDIATIMVEKIQKGSVPLEEGGIYHFMIIAEQPYAGRMAKQVQRAFYAEIERKKLKGITVVVEGVGPAVTEKELLDIGILTRMNSELGSLMAERFNDARLQMQEEGKLTLRDPKIILFMDRDTTKNHMMQVQQFALEGNHEKVEEYRVQHKIDVNFIVQSYIVANHHAKVEEYRTVHNISARVIAQNYRDSDARIPLLYVALNNLENYDLVGQTIIKAILRLEAGQKSYWNPYWMNSEAKLDAIINAVISLHGNVDLATVIDNPESDLYKALNMQRITPITFLGQFGINQAKTLMAVRDEVAVSRMEVR